METSLHEKSDQDAALPNSTEQALPESTSSITDLRRSFMDPWKLASASALDRDAEEQSLSRRTSGSEPLNHDNERQGSVGMSPEPFPRFYEEPVSLDGTLQLGTSPPFEHRPQDRGAKENYYDSGERDRVIPKQVLCYLRMMFEGERLCKKMSFYLDWQSDDSYRKIKDAAKKCLDHSPQTIDKQVWRTDGVCKLFKMNQECSSRTLENEDENQDQWFEVLHLIIAQFVAIPGNEYTKFHLEITWAYAAVKDPVTEAKGAYSTRIANLIHDRMRTNWRNQKYIPQKDIHAIMSQTVIEHLIKKDKSLQDLEHSAHTDDQSFKKEQFIHDVAIKHKRLLALCVYEELDLICLWQMVYRNGMPAKLPLNNSDRPLGAEPRRFDSLLSKQWWFQPYQFPKPTDAKNHCTKLGDEVILPIEGCGERKPIGSGSSKDVYKVQVQSGHHQFTADKTCVFALKEVRNGSASEDFERESKVLRRLIYKPHKHITPHYASWSQTGHFFMLSPLATCNLKQYWKHTKPQLVDTGFVLWELKQLQGLADGLRYIYNLGGSHFDLKGENILAFDEVGCNWPTLKIADFGSAKIQPRRSDPRDNSAPTNSYSQGTSAYEAPDYIILGHISRPCDVWTLGCIFMDMLVWTFGLLLPDQPDIETFSNERRQIKGGRVVDDTMFWYVAHDGKSKYFTYWKPALRERLQALKEVCDSDKGRAVFKELVVTTSKMLRMDPIARPKPYEIHNDMERITLWAEEPVKEEDANVQDRLIGTVPPTSKSEYAGKSVDDGMPVEAPRAVLMGSSIVFPDAYLARTPRPTRRLLPDGTDLHFMGSNEALHKESESTTFQLAVDGVDHLSGSQTPGPGIKAHRPLIGSHWMSPDRDTFAEAQTVVPSVAFSDDYPAPPSQWSNPGKRRGDRLEVPGNPKRRCSIS